MENEFDSKDIQENKGMAFLAYLGPLVLVPMFAAKESEYARFHTNQGLVLCIASVAYSFVCSMVDAVVLALGWRLYLISVMLRFAGLLFPVLELAGLVNVSKGAAKELPLIGKIRLVK